MMHQRKFPVKFEIHQSGAPATALGGLALVLQLLASTGILARLPRDLKPGQGWTDGHMLLALVLMNVAGLDRVSDIDRLEGDRALRRLVRRFEPAVLGRRPDTVGRRFRRGRRRGLPSARSIHDWLEGFHVAGAETAWKVRDCCTNFPAPDACPAERANGLPALAPQEVVRQAHDRCGHGEEIHAVLKDDFAGGMMPSGRFGANAAWMAAAAVAVNVVALLRRAALGANWAWRRMKRVRARWIHHVARVARRGRRTVAVLPEEARHVAAALRRLVPASLPP